MSELNLPANLVAVTACIAGSWVNEIQTDTSLNRIVSLFQFFSFWIIGIVTKQQVFLDMILLLCSPFFLCSSSVRYAKCHPYLKKSNIFHKLFNFAPILNYRIPKENLKPLKQLKWFLILHLPNKDMRWEGFLGVFHLMCSDTLTHGTNDQRCLFTPLFRVISRTPWLTWWKRTI